MSLGSLFGTYQSLLNNATGVLSISGTPLQISASGSYTTSQVGDIVLSLPQNIDTTSSPTFAGLTLSGLSAGILGVSASGVFYSNSVTAPLSYDSVGHILSINYNNNLRNNAGYLDVVTNPTFAGLTLTGYNGLLKATAGVISATTLTTDDISEGKTNLYYTAVRARSALSSSNPISYNSTTGAIGLNYDGNFTLSGSNLSTIQPITTSSNVSFRSVIAGTGGFSGALSGNVTGNLTGNVIGNASTATALSTSSATTNFWRGDNTWASPLTAISATAPVSYAAGVVSLNYNNNLRNNAGNLDVVSSPLFTGINIGSTSSSIQSNFSGSFTAPAAVNAYGKYYGGTLSLTTPNLNMYGSYIAPTFVGPASFSGNCYGLYCSPSFSGVAPGAAYGAVFTTPSSGTNRVAGYFETLNVGVNASTSYASGTLRSITFYNSGDGQISNQMSIGTTVPQTNTRLYISAGGIATENYCIQSNVYPVRTSGVSSYANITAYANWAYMSGGTMNYYAIDTGQTSGSSPYIGSAFGLYCRNPGASTTPANNIACYADDISVGNTSNKIANGIYCSSHLKCGGDLYNGTYSTSSPFYAVSTASATVQMGTNSTTVTVSYRRVGSVVTCRIPPWTNNYSSAGNATITIPSGFIPTQTAQNWTYWPYTSTALISTVSVILITSSGTLTFYNGSVGNFPTGSYSSFPNQIVFTYIID